MKHVSAGEWLLWAATHITLAGMFYLWQVKGVEQAGNVFVFYVWLIGVLGSLAVFTEPKAKDYRPRTALCTATRLIASVLVLLGALWAGHAFAATFFAVAILGGHAHRIKAKEAWEAGRVQ